VHKNYHWFKIAESITELNFDSNGLLEKEVNGKRICFAIFKNKLSACAQKCPHAGGLMAKGFIDAAGNIVCPLHRYKFNLQTGQNISGEGYFLKTFVAEIREDGVFVGFLGNNFLNWLK